MRKILVNSAMALCVAPAAHAVDIKAGDWNVNVGGIVNAYYTHVSCSGDAPGGLALASRAIGCGERMAVPPSATACCRMAW